MYFYRHQQQQSIDCLRRKSCIVGARAKAIRSASLAFRSASRQRLFRQRCIEFKQVLKFQSS